MFWLKLKLLAGRKHQNIYDFQFLNLKSDLPILIPEFFFPHTVCTPMIVHVNTYGIKTMGHKIKIKLKTGLKQWMGLHNWWFSNYYKHYL